MKVLLLLVLLLESGTLFANNWNQRSLITSVPFVDTSDDVIAGPGVFSVPEDCNPTIKFAGINFPDHGVSKCYGSRYEADQAGCTDGVVKDLSDPRFEASGYPVGKSFYCLRPQPNMETLTPKRSFTNQDQCENRTKLYGDFGLQYKWMPSIFSSTSLEPGDCQCRPVFSMRINYSHSNEGYQVCNLSSQVQAVSNSIDSPSATIAEGQPSNQQRTETFDQCIARAKSSADQCKTISDQLTTRCSLASSDSTAGSAANAAGTLSNVYTQTQAGTGSQSSCFKAGLLSNAARISAEATSDSCKSGVESCHNNCPTNAYEDLRKQCAALVNNMSPEALESSGLPQAQQFHDMSVEIQPKFASGQSACQTQGDDKLGSLNQMLGGVGNALQGSLRCACQLASGCSSSADSIPLAQDCVSNPSLAGCQVYGEMSVCTPGSSYNAALCRCQTNPSADGCAGVQTTGTLASMASGLIQTNTSGTSSFATAPTAVPSSGSANNLDLSGGSDSSGVSLDTTAKSGAPGSRQPYVSGGGGGLGSGGSMPPDQSVANTNNEKSGILGGIMSAIKTSARALGFGRSKSNGNYGGYSSTGSTRTFAPRGLAGGRSGVGSRNMDIWMMMNKCVQADTCPSNSGQFISGP